MIKICDSAPPIGGGSTPQRRRFEKKHWIEFIPNQAYFGWHSVMVHRDDLVLVESSDFLLTH